MTLPGPFSHGWLLLLWLLPGGQNLAAADAVSPVKGLAELVDLEYKREVLIYCGISDPAAIRGFLDRQSLLIAQHGLGEDLQFEAASQARQLSYAEWQNRGLGGFRGWCRNEAMTYTEILKSYVTDTGESQ